MNELLKQYHEEGFVINPKNIMESSELISMILIQKWLRDEKNIYILIDRVYNYADDRPVFNGWSIYIDVDNPDNSDKINNKLINLYFKSYEESLEYGLKEALQIIKNDNNK